MSTRPVARHASRLAIVLGAVLGVTVIAMGHPGAALADEDGSHIEWSAACGIATGPPVPIEISSERPASVGIHVSGSQVTFATTEAAGCSLVRDQGLGTRVAPADLTFFTSLPLSVWFDVCAGEMPQQANDLNLALTSPGWPDGAQMDNIVTEFFGNEGELILHFQRSTRLQGFAVFERASGSPPCHETGARWEGHVVLVDPQVPGFEEPSVPTVTDLVNLVRGSTPA